MTRLSLDESLRFSLQDTLKRLQRDPHHETLRQFYQPREFVPLWVNSEGPLPGADLLRETLAQADREGLDRADYPLALIDHLWHAREPVTLARLELTLSRAVLDYGRDVQRGRTPPEAVNPLWHIPVDDFDGGHLLERLSRSRDMASVLAALPPPHPQYQDLRRLLAYYRQLALLGGWPVVPAGPTLRIGDTHPQVPLLRQRLFADGDLLLDVHNPEPVFDADLHVAVERFQHRHGLKVDGIVGPATRTAMNITVTQRIAQIRDNMERWRWLPRELEPRNIIVNIPAYRLVAHAEGEPVLEMDVIVGQLDRPTPILRGELYNVVINPDWVPTTNILIKDLIPEQLRNPEYMPARNIRVYRNGEELDPRAINWRKVNVHYQPFQLRQDPGPLNPMGRFKFLFSNDQHIYLHDTPQRGLFTRIERTFSSGCVRVTKPEALANFILAANNAAPNRVSIRSPFNNRTPHTKRPALPPQVYLVYFTTWLGDDNRAHFRDDIYALDQKMRAVH